MIESMRAYGYTLATAVADLVDNSIAAGASTIWIDSHWSGEGSWLAITDDGRGMTETELKNAMRLGSRSPLEEREAEDLGRFGLGLKTASFSQCRRLTVFSKTNTHAAAVRRWDLDHLARPNVHGWQLLVDPHPDTSADLGRLEALNSGTTVLWEVLDRVVHRADTNDHDLRGHFLELVDGLELRLGMVFHRFLENKRDAIAIVLNDVAIRAWDPYARHHPATQSTPEETLFLGGFEYPIKVQGFILPHKDRLGAEQHGRLSGPKGWNAQQGFYLYRNERLIVSGSWLGLGGPRPWTQEEHYKLARIRLDVPNAMDHLWQLDVKKSHATPPPRLRQTLLGLAQTVRKDARSVFAHRGMYRTVSKRVEYTRAWKRVLRQGQPAYRIDRKHPVVSAVFGDLPQKYHQPVTTLLSVIEETVPVEQIWLDTAETPDGHGQPFHNTPTDVLRSVVVQAYRLVRSHRSLTHSEAVEVLGACEEFATAEAAAILALLEGGREE